MATEAPIFAHSHCTASADLSSTGTSLQGPNGTAQFLAVKISGVGTVTVAAANSDVVHGILQNDPKSGQAANVAFGGISKAVAGAAITAGAVLMSDTSGRVITQTSPGTNPCLGQALDTSTAAGQVIRILIVPGIGIQ